MSSSPGRKAEIVIQPLAGLFHLRLGELWEYRELLFFLVWRDVTVRYKQTILGAAWAILQPVLTMVIFSLIFGRLAQLPSDGLPYPIFTYTALLPWQLFARGVSDASNSLISNHNMITKTYFPRIILPISSVLSGLVDFSFSFLVLLGLMIFYQVPVTWRVVTLPLFLLLVLLTALAAGLWLGVMNVQFRDIKYVTPFLMEFWKYATPVAYSLSLIPENWWVFYGLNPMTGVVTGFRWAMLGETFPIAPSLLPSIVVVLLMFFWGLVYFQNMEKTFADRI
ncbi:MAG: ABC transporter permease [Anaerolineae bacterium]|nr:ABC transporter permease [Anaerolineae bacterium]